MTRAGVTTHAATALAQIADGAKARALETLTLEFKRPKDSFEDTARDLAEAVACFANSAGGTVVVGVDERTAGPRAFIGCPYDAERLRRRIWELTNPSLTVAAVSHAVGDEGPDLVLLLVAEGFEVHTVAGRASHRIDTACEPMSATEQARLVDDRRGSDWSGELSELDATEVSPVAVAAARQLLRVHPDPQRQRLAALSDADLLRALGVADGEGRLRRAGALLFAETDGSEAITYQFRRSPGGELADIHRLGQPLLLSFQRLLELVAARIDRTPILLPTGQQVELADLPETPVREALANAIAHRDWRIPEPVSVEHAPTRLIVESPGPLVSGVTVDNILAHPSKPRNRALIEAIRKLGLAEQAGVGVDRMYRDMIRSGHQPPSITESTSVRVSLTGGAPNRSLARYVASLPASVADDVDAMLVIFTLLTKRNVTAHKLSPVLQKPKAKVEAVLTMLASDAVSMLETTRQTVRLAHPTYRFREHALRELGTAVTYRRRTADEIDRKVIATVSELGQITNGVVQNLFDVKVERASRILADLVERGILQKTSPHERGPRVTYGPGANFPSRPATRRRRTSRPNDEDS